MLFFSQQGNKKCHFHIIYLEKKRTEMLLAFCCCCPEKSTLSLLIFPEFTKRNCVVNKFPFILIKIWEAVKNQKKVGPFFKIYYTFFILEVRRQEVGKYLLLFLRWQLQKLTRLEITNCALGPHGAGFKWLDCNRKQQYCI